MKKFIVHFHTLVPRFLVVEASSQEEAARLTQKIAPRPFGATFENVIANEALELARLSTYSCMFCGHQDLKEAWGPGRITCPTCKRQQTKEETEK